MPPTVPGSALGELACPRQVGPCRVDRCLLVARNERRQDLVSGDAAEDAVLRDHGGPVDGEVDGPAQPRVVAEERAVVVQRHVGHAAARVDPVPRAVPPVAVPQLGMLRRRDALLVVSLVREHLVEARLQVDQHREVDAVEVPRAVPTIERVPPHRDRPVRLAGRDVVRPGRRQVVAVVDVDDLVVPRQAGVDRLEERHRELGEEHRARLRQVDDQPVAAGRMPEAFCACPSRTRWAPTMFVALGSEMNWNAGDWSSRPSARLSA